jgi:agmatinase
MESYQKSKQIKKFDPNGVGQKGKLFGLPFDLETSEVVVIPVPWDVTASFGSNFLICLLF